jgi:hypothetical protein
VWLVPTAASWLWCPRRARSGTWWAVAWGLEHIEGSPVCACG